MSWVAVVTAAMFPSSLRAEEASAPAPQEGAPQAPDDAAPAPIEKQGAPTGAKLITIGQRKKPDMFSFGLHLGQPTGLQAKARLLDLNLLGFNTTHSVVAMVGYDFFYGGVTFHLDYRLDVLRWEFLPQDAEVALWIGGGPRLSILEPAKTSRRELPFSLGARVTPGVTLTLNPLPLEISAYATPLSFDVNTLSWPRWRPELGLEMRVRFPYAPQFWPG